MFSAVHRKVDVRFAVPAIGYCRTKVREPPIGRAIGGDIDLGPLGLWGLAVSIQIIRSFSWADKRIAAKDSGGLSV
jgi:hypothetical protein